jgi:hypothetical protein
VEKAATFLKVRFGEVPQLQKHLHVVEGRTVFFFREPAARLIGGERVVVEFSLAGSEQVSTLRGSVLGRVNGEGGQVGAWIEFPDAKLAKRLERGATALGMRQHQRVTCDLLVEVRQGRHLFLARMMDVSMGGARILGATAPRVGAMPLRPGASVELRIVGAIAPFPADLGRAEVVRTDAQTGELAVRWVRSDPVVRAASLKLIDAARAAWGHAQQMVHAPSCCAGGGVLDPPTPLLKRRL